MLCPLICWFTVSSRGFWHEAEQLQERENLLVTLKVGLDRGRWWRRRHWGSLVPQQLLEALLINTPGPWGGVRPGLSYLHGNARGGCAVICKRREKESIGSSWTVPVPAGWRMRPAHGPTSFVKLFGSAAAALPRARREGRREAGPHSLSPGGRCRLRCGGAVADRSPSRRAGMSGDQSRSLGKGKRRGQRRGPAALPTGCVPAVTAPLSLLSSSSPPRR